MKWIWLSLFLFVFDRAFSQSASSGNVKSSYTFQHYTTANGLPQIQITALFSDSKGFVWVGTKFGLARWDGKKFKLFTQREGAAGWQVVGMAELDDGRIVVWWQSDGFNIIDGDQIEKFQLPAEWAVSSIFNIVPGPQNRLLIGVNVFQDEKLYKKSLVATYDISKRKFVREDWYNEWWLGLITPEGFVVNSFGNQTQEVSKEYHLYQNGKLIDSRVFEKQFSLFNRATPDFINLFTENKCDTVYYIKVANNKLVLANEATGISSKSSTVSPHAVYKIDKSKFVYTDKQQDLYLQTNGARELIAKIPELTIAITDKEGNLWAGTENGLYCFFRLGIKEYFFNVQPGAVDAIWSMDKGKDGIYYYASYDKGFWLSKDNNKTWTRIVQVDKQESNQLMRKGTYALRSFSDGSVLLPTAIGFHHLKNNRLTSYSLYGKGAEIYASWEDTARSSVLISKYTYLLRLNLQTLKLDTVLNPHNLFNHPILNIVSNRNHQPVITGGVNPHVLVNDKWQPIKGGEQVFGTTSACDYKNSVWVGSIQRLRCLRNDTVFEMKYFPVKQMVLSMTTWKDKWLIIGGGVELVFMDLEAYYERGEELYYVFDSGDGLTTTEGGQNSFVLDDDGSVWWCCSDKVIRFWPEKLIPARSQVLLVPGIFSVNAADRSGRTQLLADSMRIGSFSLGDDFRRLEFYFGAASMSGSNNLKYRYRLLGSDTSWSNPSANTIAVFDRLSPGSYLFQVQATRDGNDWSNTASFPAIEIKPFWYETIIAKVLAGIFLLGSIILLTTLITNRKKKTLERRKLLNELQLKAIRSKALPHFTGNSFANIDFYVEKGDKENASRYLAILSRLHNITLADSDKPSRTLKEELDYVRLYLTMEKLRFEDKFDYEIKIEEEVDYSAQVPNMILHTFTENALKHGLKNKKAPGRILIEIRKLQDGIQLEVSDDGIGRKAAEEKNTGGSKQGLRILTDQLSLYNELNQRKISFGVQDLTDSGGKSAGTKFSIFIPENFKY